MPFLSDVVPDVPLIAASDTAFMSPDVRIPVDELVDVELESLRLADVLGIEVDVVGEVVQAGNQGFVCVGKPLRRKIANEVIVPEGVRINGGSANIHLRS